MKFPYFDILVISNDCINSLPVLGPFDYQVDFLEKNLSSDNFFH